MSFHFRTPEGWLIDRRLRQRMAPSMQRILEYMEAHPGRYADHELAAAIYCDRGVAKDVLNKLHKAGILRIAGYRRTGSTPQALYGFFDGREARCLAAAATDERREATQAPRASQGVVWPARLARAYLAELGRRGDAGD